jgi:hypothetical protein
VGLGWAAGRRTSTRVDGFCRWRGFETEWTEGRPRGSAAWTARRFATGFTASTPRVRMGFSITGRKARSLGFQLSRWPSLRRSSRLARSVIFNAAGQLKSLQANDRSFVLSTEQFKREHDCKFWDENEQ